MMDSLLAGERLNRKAQRCTQTRRKRTPWTTLRRTGGIAPGRGLVAWTGNLRGPATQWLLVRSLKSEVLEPLAPRPERFRKTKTRIIVITIIKKGQRRET